MKRKTTTPAAPYRDDWFTAEDLADRFGKSREWVFDTIVKPGLIPCRKIGSLHIWHRHRIDEWLLNDTEVNQ